VRAREIERPTEEIRRERERLADEYCSLLDQDARKSFDELLALSRTVFPMWRSTSSTPRNAQKNLYGL